MAQHSPTGPNVTATMPRTALRTAMRMRMVMRYACTGLMYTE
jgi:hypothetical protein